jgi:phosphoglycerol transferase MdoB-like AlkP superfamily enzyme
MKEIIINLIKRLLFWLLVFLFSRAIFLMWEIKSLRIEQIAFYEAVKGFWYALPLDIAAASYLMVVTFLIFIFYQIFRKSWILMFDRIYTLIALIAFFLITTAELGIYDEWKTKLPYKALFYLNHPGEIYDSTSGVAFFLLLFLLAGQVVIWFFIFNKYFRLKKSQIKFRLVPFLLIILTPIFLFLGIRGGWSAIPINQSQSYYSKHNILNLAAINSGYSFLFSTLESFAYKSENPFRFMDQAKAEQIVEKLHKTEADTTISVLKTNCPNIVILIMESWTGDVIESISSAKGITPEFKELEKEGILFTQLYASGNRSEQGIECINSGFPATPITSLTHHLEKIPKLPSLAKVLKGENYFSSFYFGGQLIYGGIKSYLMVSGFDRVLEETDFSRSLPRGKLGIIDEQMFDQLLAGLNSQNQPFLSELFTISSHSPYDQPKDTVIHFADSENDFLNSVYYTDHCLGEFFRKARPQSWFSNTLFVIVADHSHNSQFNHSILSVEYRKIPLLLYGDVIKDKFRGIQVNRISSQNDIPGTLLNQLGLPSDQFYWSRDLFNPGTPEFAYFEATEGVGWVCPDGYFVYHRKIKDYAEIKINPEKMDSVIMNGKAYLQVVFQRFLDM